MHKWGDAGVDWAGINAAAAFIADELVKAGIPVRDFKEKFGTVRVYCDPSDDQSKAYYAAYEAAVEKWPHLRQEILHGADYPEMLIGLGYEEG